jgi:hypothetical protein
LFVRATEQSFAAVDDNGRPVGTPGGPLAYWASADVTASGSDVNDVTLQLHRALSISGRVTNPGRFNVRATPAGAPNPASGPSAAPTSADGTFRLDGLMPGLYRLSASPSAVNGRLTARSAMLGGQDLFDTPLDLRTSVSGVEMTFSDAMASLTGTLVDAAGHPTPQFYVFIFPVDHTYWTDGSRRIVSARADVKGVYTLSGLPSGDYYVCALTALDRTQQYEASFLDQLVAASIKITLAEGEKKTQSLRVGG